MKSILFKSEMTAAILAEDPDYQKTITRRPLKPQIPEGWEMGTSSSPGMTLGAITSPHPKKGRFGLFIRREIWPDAGKYEHDIITFPYGRPGEIIYVKETYWAWGRWETRFDKKKGRDAWHFIDMTRECGKEYQFSQPVPMGTRAGTTPAWHKRPSLFMPRHASRIQLRIEDVRVERLAEISEEDAVSEGCYSNDQYSDLAGNSGVWPCERCHGYQVHEQGSLAGSSEVDCTACNTSRKRFKQLWQSINGADSWEENPLVWVITLKRLEDTNERYQRIAS